MHVGSSVVRTRSEVRGPCSELGEGGGAVALTVALLFYTTQRYLNTRRLPHTVHVGKEREGYGQALRALREVVKTGITRRVRPPLA